MKILDAIKENEEIAENIGISLRAVEKQLARLKQDGLIKRVGTARGGHWEICR